VDNGDNRQISLWVAMALLLALFVGAAAGIIALGDYHHGGAALLTAGSAFGATVTVALLVINTLRG
jgi:hypothetical protein